MLLSNKYIGKLYALLDFENILWGIYMSNYPWKQIAQFHREIGVRSEESFFTFKADDSGSERYSFIYDSVFEKTQINSEVSFDKFTNQSVFVNMEQINNEFFVGGLFWFTLQNINNNWVKHCHPVVYKPYHIFVNENSTLSFEPLQANWEVSPLFLKLLDKKGIALNGNVEDEVKSLIEEANLKCREQSQFCSSFNSVLIKKYPELEKEFIKNAPQNAVSNWLVFSAPKDHSAIMRNLIIDYDKLIEKLESEPDNIGGFTLFENSEEKAHDDVEVTSLVPLNENQLKVVSSIISGNEITVVSGPPGCGKSQVVLSILLNSWKNNKSVLFASSNNQAVDVIRERIKKYERDVPLVVRTGSKRTSELLPSIERMSNLLSNYVSQNQRNVDADIIRYKRNYEEFDRIINSNIPQQVNELYKSALASFGNAEKLKNEANEIINAINNEINNSEIKSDVFSFNKLTAISFSDWIKSHEDMLREIENNAQKKSKINNEISKLNLEITSVVGKYYTVDYVTINCDKLNKLIDSYTNLKNFLLSYSSSDFKPVPYNSLFDIWTDKNDTEIWLKKANTAFDNVTAFNNRYRATVEMILDKEKRCSEFFERLSEKGVKPASSEQIGKLKAWKSIYNEFILLNDSSFPFSKKNVLRRKLRNIEVELLNLFETSTISNFSNESDSIRKLIAEVYDNILSEFNEMAEIGSLKQESGNIDNEINKLNNELSPLGISRIVTYSEIDSVKVELTNKISLAKSAKEYYLSVEKKRVFKENLISIVNDCVNYFFVYTHHILPDSDFSKLYGYMTSGMFELEAAELYLEFMPCIISGKIDNFLVELDSIGKLQSKMKNLINEIADIPSIEKLQHDWLKSAPESFKDKICSLTYSQVIKLLPMWDNKVKEINKKCEESLIEINRIREEADISHNWGVDNLYKAIDKAPEELLSKPKDEIFRHFDNRGYHPEFISGIFSKIEINYLITTRNNIKTHLDSLTLTKMQEERMAELCDDDSVKVSLANLALDYNSNGETISDGSEHLFKNVLKALPLWITTGNSPQSIPMQSDLFDILIIDEATQCTITSILPLMYRCRQIVVIGDIEQLPSIDNISISSERYISTNYGVGDYLSQLGHCGCNIYKSVLNLLPNRNGSIYALTDHYRSHPLIIGFSNNHIYRNKLVLKKQMRDVDLNSVFGVFGVDVKGSALKDSKTDSWYNPEEGNKVIQLISEIQNNQEYSNMSIGVITPFRGQVEYIANELNKYSMGINISVSTVHKYQGDERDIIVFSPVISSGISEGAANWVQSPPNLINVAITRAKEALYVVSDFAICRRQRGILGDLIQYVEKVEKLRKTSLFELQLFGLMTLQNWKIEIHPIINDIEIDFLVSDDKGMKVAVEVDGSQHINQQVQDAGRDALIRSKGLDVVRISAKAISETPLDAINIIQKKLEELIPDLV